MELGSYFLFLQEQIKNIIIIRAFRLYKTFGFEKTMVKSI